MSMLTRDRLEVPASSGRFKPGKNWPRDMERLLRLEVGPMHGGDMAKAEQEVELALRWIDRHDFWGTNVLSPAKLRKQWFRLRQEAQEKSNGGLSAASKENAARVRAAAAKQKGST